MDEALENINNVLERCFSSSPYTYDNREPESGSTCYAMFYFQLSPLQSGYHCVNKLSMQDTLSGTHITNQWWYCGIPSSVFHNICT